MDSRALWFDELRGLLLGSAKVVGLLAYAIETKLELRTLTRELSFLCVPCEWKPPFRHRAEVRVEYDPHQHLVAYDPEGLPREPDDVTFDLEIGVIFHLVSQSDDLPLGRLEGETQPRLARLKGALGVQKLAVHYVVAADYEGRNEAVGAQVPWTMKTRLCLAEIDFSLLAPVRSGLEALGP